MADKMSDDDDDDEVWKNCLVHRFIYECYYRLLPDGMVVDHINDIRDDNRLSNLQLMTRGENCKKAAKHTNYSFTKYSRKNKMAIKAINLMTGEVHYFPSMYFVEKDLGVCQSTVKKVCDREYYYKSGRSKMDDYYYTFEYMN